MLFIRRTSFYPLQPFIKTVRRVASYGLLAGCSVLVVGCKQPDPDPLEGLSTDQIAVVQALNRSILPLQNADPNRDFSELTPLDTVLAKAQVIGMGEATHGTREFFQMKDRLFRYLVQKHGYQTIAFEANFGRSVIVNRFIHGQNTDLTWAAAAARSMYFWTWSTDEVRELLQWMKDYNVNKPVSQQLSFYGFDCQYADDEFPLIREFLAKVDPNSVATVDSLVSLFALGGNAATNNTIRQQYAQRLPALYTSFVTNENKWVATGGREEYEIARQAARVLIQQQDLGDPNACNAYIKRDQYMAENVQWLRTRMNIGKVSLWAHNYHIANIPSGTCSMPSMGGYLKQQLQDKYLTIGTSLTNGSFTVKNAAATDAPLTKLSVRTEDVNTSYNYLFGKSQYANFAFNLNQSQLDPILTSWLSATRPFFEAGAVYDETHADRYYSQAALRGRFDVLLHFRDTTPTQLLN